MELLTPRKIPLPNPFLFYFSLHSENAWFQNPFSEILVLWQQIISKTQVKPNADSIV